MGISATAGRAGDLREKALGKALEAKALLDEDGNLPAAETDRFNELMAEFHQLDEDAAKASTADDNAGSLQDRLEYYTGKATGTPMRFSAVPTDHQAPKSVGQQFVESDAYKGLTASGALKSEFSRIGVSGHFVTKPKAAADDVIHTEPGGPAASLVRPRYLDDILPLDSRPRMVRSLFAQETAPDQPIRDARQVTREGAAAAVAQTTDPAAAETPEQGRKPQFSVSWEEYEVAPKTIAAWTATTRQALSQENRVRSLIDDNGRILLELAAEDEILTGSGAGPHILGLLNTPGVQTYDASGSPYGDLANLNALRIAKRLIRTGPARVPADAVVLNPEDSEAFDLLVDGEGRYRAGDPFGAYGGEDPAIWRLRRVESEAIALGTAIVGNFRLGGTVFTVQPMVIYTSDSHEDFFVKNLIAILFEERLGLFIRRPAAFVVVTLA
jgi:hypothetical protein